jgi:hypothetical protein
MLAMLRGPPTFASWLSASSTWKTRAASAKLRALRDQLPVDVPLIAGGAGAMTMEKELAAMNVRVRSSISGFLSELRRDTIAS